jgi:hypothetical protein
MSTRIVTLAAICLSLLSTISIARAGDAKVISGFGCYEIGGTSGNWRPYASNYNLMTNTSSSVSIKVFCPLTRDDTLNTDGLNFITVWVYSLASTYVKCTATSYKGDGITVLKSVSGQATTTGVGWIDFRSTNSPANGLDKSEACSSATPWQPSCGNYGITCVVPPFGSISKIHYDEK